MATVAEIFETMEYGPAPESDKEALAWLGKHERVFGHYIGGAWTEPGETFVGRDAVRAGFIKMLAHDRDSISEPGDVHTFSDRGVSTWGFRRQTPDGRSILVRGCDSWLFRDGLMVRKESYRKTFA